MRWWQQRRARGLEATHQSPQADVRQPPLQERVHPYFGSLRSKRNQSKLSFSKRKSSREGKTVSSESMLLVENHDIQDATGTVGHEILSKDGDKDAGVEDNTVAADDEDSVTNIPTNDNCDTATLHEILSKDGDTDAH